MDDGRGLRPADLKEYVDIHGRSIRVEVNPTGEYLIPLADLKQTGFNIYVKSQYNRLLVDESDFTEEFNNHMLNAAKTWCMSNKHTFSGHEIVQSIQNAKMILLAEHSKKAKTPEVPKSTFLRDRSVAEDHDADIKVTKTVAVSPRPTTSTPSQAPHHSAVPPCRPLTSQNLQLHNEKLPAVNNFLNGNKIPSPKEVNDGNAFESKGNFQGRRSYEQQQPNNQNFQRRISGENNNRNGDSNGQFSHRKSGGGGGDTSGGSQYSGQFNANNNASQYNQRRSGGGGGDTNQQPPRQRINSSDTESTPLRLPHQRPGNLNNQNTPRMPPKGAFNRPPTKGGDFIPKVEMELGERKVVVTHVEASQKANSSIWVQQVSQLAVLANIAEMIEIDERKQSAVEPVLHKVYMAKHEGDWYRCRVCDLNPTKVFFLDYGNRAIVDEVKPMSEELAKTPQQVIKVTLVDDCPPPNVEDLVTLIVEKVYPNTNVHVARVKRENTDNVPPPISKMSQMSLSNPSPQARNQQQQQSPPVSKSYEQRSPPQVAPPKPAVFCGVPRPVVQLRSEMMVKLVAEQLGCFYLFSKECAEEQKEIASDIYKTELKPVGRVQTDQLVLCRHPNSGEVCRAVVLKEFDAVVKVQLLDYPKTFDVPLDAVMAITESLSKRPTTLLKSPQIVNYTKPYGDAAKAFLQKCINNKVKLKTLITESGKFDMILLETNELFSRVMQELDSPPPPPVKSNEGRVMLDSLEKVELECAKNTPLLCSTFVSLDEITVIPQTSELMVELIEKVIITVLNDDTPYVPIINEVCLGFFEDNWYRCAVRAIAGDSYSVFFIDFGNEIVLKSSEIRKLKEDLADTPILGTRIRITGCPRTPAVEAALRDKLMDNITVMDVLSFSDGKFNCSVPQTY